MVKKLRIEYADLLSFAFGLQVELRQLSQAGRHAQIHQVKSLLVQSVKDLNQKREQFNTMLEAVLSSGKQWLEQSRPEKVVAP